LLIREAAAAAAEDTPAATPAAPAYPPRCGGLSGSKAAPEGGHDTALGFATVQGGLVFVCMVHDLPYFLHGGPTGLERFYQAVEAGQKQVVHVLVELVGALADPIAAAQGRDLLIDLLQRPICSLGLLTEGLAHLVQAVEIRPYPETGHCSLPGPIRCRRTTWPNHLPRVLEALEMCLTGW
jgi:hypothetical protein